MATNAVTQRRPTRARGRKIKFGDVTVTAQAPSARLVKENVAFSTRALDRLAIKLGKPGVRIPARKDVPLYSVDDDDPDIMIRTLNGKTERGHMVDGTFQNLD